MKLSEGTIEALKNLSDINQGIYIEPGNTLVTRNKRMSGAFTVPETFPIALGIYDLKKFITILSVYENSEIEFHDKYLTMTDGRMTTEYGYTDKSNIHTLDKPLKLPSVDVKFDLTKSDMKKILTVTRAMQYPHVALVSDGTEVCIQCFDVANKANRPTSIQMGFKYGNEFNLIFEVDDISKMVLDDYHVEICRKGFAQFTGKNKVYSIVLQKDSSYGK